MKSWQKWLFAIVGAFVSIAAIPVAINESYKTDTIYYVTMWDAADVLSYYGTVLGAVAAVTALIATITYYRKQVIYEKTLQREQDKWIKIEKIVDQTLDDMHPSKINTAITETAKLQRIELLYFMLNTYKMTARSAVDKLLCLQSDLKNENFTALVHEIDLAMKQLSSLVKDYMEFLTTTAGEQIALQMMSNGESTPELTQLCAIQHISGIKERSAEINKQLSDIYENTYRPLIQSKESIFNQINQQLFANAEKLLRFNIKI